MNENEEYRQPKEIVFFSPDMIKMAYERHLYNERRINECENAAQDGDAAAQIKAGYCCEHGFGTEQSYSRAFAYYESAAEQNDIMAFNNLGVYYENGYACKRDLKKAAELYEKAANEGLPIACANLGFMYENGRGVSYAAIN